MDDDDINEIRKEALETDYKDKNRKSIINWITYFKLNYINC